MMPARINICMACSEYMRLAQEYSKTLDEFVAAIQRMTVVRGSASALTMIERDSLMRALESARKALKGHMAEHRC